ncbi:hypothetical protein EYF80_062253 [Liparis tanakae]|uniref:Uncharacterized protein n=1 Tax=Liparis tanakae TaxID=230148 RepID=A0A4Z2EG27_9TELE|nr:hypothetical protein EYF80_062253 [Liparis tanakae]
MHPRECDPHDLVSSGDTSDNDRHHGERGRRGAEPPGATLAPPTQPGPPGPQQEHTGGTAPRGSTRGPETHVMCTMFVNNNNNNNNNSNYSSSLFSPCPQESGSQVRPLLVCRPDAARPPEPPRGPERPACPWPPPLSLPLLFLLLLPPLSLVIVILLRPWAGA